MGTYDRTVSKHWLALLAVAATACTTADGMQPLAAGQGGAPGATDMSPVTGSAMPAGTGGVPAAGGAGATSVPTAGAAGAVPAGGGQAPPTSGADAPPLPDAGPDELPPDAMVTTPPREDLGEGDGSDVITIGDSWMNLGFSGIEASLRGLGKRYRNYAVPGTTLAGTIPGQYDSAKSQDPNIATVIMTGGGNDIMFSGGCNTAEACEQSVLMIVMRLNTLWTIMADDGVKDVIYIRYSADAGTSPQSTRPTEAPPPPDICLTGRIRCHSLETTDLVMGQLLDGIHPTSAANDRIAAALLELMETQGIRR